MSSENVELIKGMFAGFEGADSDAIREMLPAAIREICDPEIEFIETPERVDATTYHGHEGVLKAFNRWLDSGTNTAARPRASRITAMTCS